ncbi:hypothetical protein M2426_000921, partial [Pseudomonas moraviensis]|uniref:hypothetical protein n=1 Tax=Pseudomonas moraviensis TaxID=321662 RepID=UPI003D1B4F4D
NLKEFSVSTAPEVGRIIDLWNLPSTVNFAFLSTTCRLAKKQPIEREISALYIEERLRGLLLP